MDKDYPKVTPPPTFVPPDDKQEGDTFSATVEFRIDPGNKLCLLSIDGVPFKDKAKPTLAEAVQAQRETGENYTM